MIVVLYYYTKSIVSIKEFEAVSLVVFELTDGLVSFV